MDPVARRGASANYKMPAFAARGWLRRHSLPLADLERGRARCWLAWQWVLGFSGSMRFPRRYRLVAIGLACAALLSCAGERGNRRRPGESMTAPFDTKAAAALLGHPGETFDD